MKRRRAITAVVAASGAAWLSTPAAGAPAQPGEPVAWPDVTLLGGTRWTAADAQDKAVVVVFWSVSCPFCARHNAHVERLRVRAAGAPLAVLGVARERDPQAVRQKMAQHGWHFAVTLDDAPMALALSSRRMVPLTVTVDRRGRLKQVIPGEMFEADVLELLRLAA